MSQGFWADKEKEKKLTWEWINEGSLSSHLLYKQNTLSTSLWAAAGSQLKGFNALEATTDTC